MAVDPIVDSSPARETHAPRHSHPSSDSEDEPLDIYVTQATMPLAGAKSSYFPRAQHHPSPLPQSSTFQTQPTQLLDTPKKNRMVDPQVQVAASSPAIDRSSRSPASQRPVPSIFAPPGTFLRRPPAVPRPAPIDLFSDDPPVEVDSEEETTMRSNIKPSVFESGTPRVAETPQKSSFNLSSFAYDKNNTRKRQASIDLVGSSKEKKPRPEVPQSRPSRAIPVDADIELDDIHDYGVRKNVGRLKAILPDQSIKTLQSALALKKGNYQDALDYLTSDGGIDVIELSDDDLLITPPVAKAKPAAKRELKAPNKSIHEKFTTIRNAPAKVSSPDPAPKKKGRLQRGRKNPSLSPQLTPQHSTPKHRAVAQEEDEDVDEGIVISSGDDMEASGTEEVQLDNAGLLDFFNTSSVQAMADLCNQKEDIVEAVFEYRPFRSLADVEKVNLDPPPPKGKKVRKPKVPIGEKLVDFASDMWNGYQAIDQLVTKCENLGKPIAAAMAKWGVDIFGASTDGELSLTKVSESLGDLNSIRDSGFGTPEGDSESELGQQTGKGKFVGQPTIMAKDIQLKDYQLVGLNWLNLLWQHGMSCILADDMGLGKTCQVIAFLSHLHERGLKGPHLVIVPGSTLENWLREFQHFSPSLAVEPYYGSQGARNEQQLKILDNIRSIDVIVTTYDLAYKKIDNSFLKKCKPVTCVFDEGHVLKNSTTQRYKSLMRIPTKFRLLLTGTPLQNNLRELASILAFIMPDIFHDLEEDLALVFKHKAKTSDTDHAALLSTQRIKRARSMMAPFVLRRKKAQVLQHLPKKTCRVEYCELTESQQEIYSDQLAQQRQVLLDRAAGKPNKDHTNVMMRLRQAAIHPLLFRKVYDDDVIRKMSKSAIKESEFKNSDPKLIVEDLEIYQDFQCHQLCLKYPTHLGKYALKNEEWMDSGKVKKLVELLTRFKENGDRTLIFSQFTSVMDILEWVFESIGMSFFRLDGQTPIAQRQDMFDEFYADETIPVFMLSTKSGGAGINLACANKVIIFDSSFNPQDDIQAENRAHRVGQTRDVEVIRLVTKGTVEEQIHALGISKLELDKLVAGEDAADDKKKGLSAVEEVGLEAVEKMLMEQMTGDDIKKGSDLKDQYKNGLEKAGLDLSAA
ncbi:hypothetical protein GQ43DRAFT_438170 [Delitschia confertaspora ATCC 74209]|uniref:DNA helicase n=1 Tax=Delitschia confertaspora ATCC 74209 TaxID=1513339 RepID=A0A9P4JS58_9PLEO|nr:hypothetical protein GQ43DRAFT_438170 [Delitschia confertaspora ATCC 74209]